MAMKPVNARQVLEELLESLGCWKPVYKHWAVDSGRYVAIVRSNFCSKAGNPGFGLKVSLGGVCATVQLAKEATAEDAIQFMTRRVECDFSVSEYMEDLAPTIPSDTVMDSIDQVAERSGTELVE